MSNFILMGVTTVLGLGIIYVLQKGFNETIKGMESLSKQLQRIEEKLDREEHAQ